MGDGTTVTAGAPDFLHENARFRVRTACQARIAARRDSVRAFLGRGLTVPQIARALGVAVRTAAGDVRAVREETGLELRITSAQDVGVQVLFAARARENELWKLFVTVEKSLSPTEAVRARLSILKELRACVTETTSTLQSLGVVYRAPTTAAIDIRYRAFDALGKVDGSMLKRMADAETEDEWRKLAAEAIGPELAGALAVEPAAMLASGTPA